MRTGVHVCGPLPLFGLTNCYFDLSAAFDGCVSNSRRPEPGVSGVCWIIEPKTCVEESLYLSGFKPVTTCWLQ